MNNRKEELQQKQEQEDNEEWGDREEEEENKKIRDGEIEGHVEKDILRQILTEERDTETERDHQRE